MRIVLDRQQLLGFENDRAGLSLPVTAAKVGTKPTVCVGVSTARHSILNGTDLVPARAPLTYPS